MQAKISTQERDKSYSLSYNHTSSMLARSMFIYIQSAGHFVCNREYNTIRQGYDSFLLIYTLQGAGVLKYRGKAYESGANQVILIDCNDYQEYYTGSSGHWEFKFIHFNGVSCAAFFQSLFGMEGPVITLGSVNSMELYLDTVLNLMKNRDIQFEIKAALAATQMLTDLMLAVTAQVPNFTPGNSNDMVEAALSFIEKNYRSDLQIKDMAQAVCCSKYHFIRVFKKAAGYSPYEYLVKYRINRSKDLLKTSRMSIEEIAGTIGFKSTSSFIRTFRELEAMTPFKYRKYWQG